VKRCSVCGIDKPLDAFYANRGSRDGYRNDCKACNLERRKAAYRANPRPTIERELRWRKAYPEDYAKRQREYRESGRKAIADRKSYLKRTYGLTVEQYEAMLDAQGGVCFICRETPGDLPLHVDHDHASGGLRKLLCIRCNNALGLFQESPQLFQAAADYLRARDHDVSARPK
jgi:hypothetical protein